VTGASVVLEAVVVVVVLCVVVVVVAVVVVDFVVVVVVVVGLGSVSGASFRQLPGHVGHINLGLFLHSPLFAQA
jgi:hypothetical protein